MIINKIDKNAKKDYLFIIRKPDGSEHEKVVSANSESEAHQRLKNLLEIFRSRDRIIGLKS